MKLFESQDQIGQFAFKYFKYINPEQRKLSNAYLIFFVSRSNNNYVTIISMELIFAAAESLYRLWATIVLAAP